MNARLFIVAALVMASLAACGSAPGDAAARADPPLAGATIGGPFALIDQNGARFTDRDLRGRYAIVYFGYTYCPDVCPVDLQKLMRGLAAFERTHPAAAANLQPVFISVDPERDTPAVLKRFVASFGPRLVGLTGSADAIASVAKAYAVSYSRQEGATPGSYLMGHSQIAYLMGPQGEPIALLPLDDPSTDADEGSAGAVAAELARWVAPAS